MRGAVLVALVFTGVVLAEDAEGLRLRVEAWLTAKDEATKKTALDALDGLTVPKELAARVAALRRSLPPPAPRKGNARFDEKVGEADAYFATPKGYDGKKLASVLISIAGHAKGDDRHWGLTTFTLPDEEWAELNARIKAKYPTAEIKKKPLMIPYDDGIVVSPSYEKDNLDGELAETAILATLERLNRTYAADPDRVVISGLSMGGGNACSIAVRHPDRFAGVFAVAGYDPNYCANLAPLQVYLVHGTHDKVVPVTDGREMNAYLTSASVTHVYREIAGLEHMWPKDEEGKKVRDWMRARVRNPWPKEFTHLFFSQKNCRRCFWVEVPGERMARVAARCKDNEIDLDVQTADSLVLHLGEPLVDLEKEVVVRWGSKEVFRGKLQRSWRELVLDLEATGFDIPRAAPARVEVKAP